MIQKNDLRIGNLVLVHNHYVAEVISIGDKIGVKTVGEPKANIDYLDLEFISSITIKEKWLLDLGFGIKEIYPKNEIHPKGWIIYEKDEFTITDDFRLQIFGKSVKIEYVHNLQNLYIVKIGGFSTYFPIIF